jgi:hypothetical protein
MPTLSFSWTFTNKCVQNELVDIDHLRTTNTIMQSDFSIPGFVRSSGEYASLDAKSASYAAAADYAIATANTPLVGDFVDSMKSFDGHPSFSGVILQDSHGNLLSRFLGKGGSTAPQTPQSSRKLPQGYHAEAASNTPERENFPVMPAAWCAVKSRKADVPPVPDPEEPAVETLTPSTEVGCDIGAALRLWGWAENRVVAVGVLGTESVGFGLAIVPYRPRSGMVGAVAVGIVAPYDAEGIYSDGVAVAVGATLSFVRREP